MGKTGCKCGYPDMPGSCPGPANCPMVDQKPAIKTEYVYPPIPERCCDWAAHRDPEGPTGWGPTEEAAIADLLEQEEA